MHTIHLLDFNTLSTNVILSRTSVLKEIILFSSHGCNVNMRNQWSVPRNMGQLALDIPFLISWKIKLSFIPTHVHACTPVLMAQPKVNPLSKNKGSSTPIISLSSHPRFPLSLQEEGIECPMSSLSLLCHQNSTPLLPSTHLKPSGTSWCWLLPITLQQWAASLEFPLPSITPAEREELSCGVHQERLPSLLASPEKPY